LSSISYLPSHTATLRQNAAPKPGRPGPKPSDSTGLIGERCGRIVVIDVLPRDEKRHTNLICSCDCGKFCTVRASDFTAGDVKSCDCLKIELFNAYQRQRVENLNADVVRSIFLDSARTGSWPGADAQVAARHKLSKHVIRFACQLHKERLLAKYGDTIRESSVIQRTQVSRSLDEIEFNWIVKNTRDNSTSGIEVEWDEIPTHEQEMFLRFASADSAAIAARAAQPLKLPTPGAYLNYTYSSRSYDEPAIFFDQQAADTTVRNWAAWVKTPTPELAAA